MVKPEKFGHLHLFYHFTVPLRDEISEDTFLLSLRVSSFESSDSN